MKLHWQIAIALAVALALGISIKLGGAQESAFAGGLTTTCVFLGDLFKNALKMVIVPLIAASIICGIMSLGSDRAFGRMGTKVLAYYSATGLIAILTGLVLVNIIRPGDVPLELAQQILGQAETSEEFVQKFEGRDTSDLIVFSLLFGFFINRLPDALRDSQRNFWEGVQGVMMKITDLIIRVAPVGVFGLVTPIIIRTGFGAFEPLLWFVITVLLALGFHYFISLGLMVKYIGRVKPSQHYRAMSPVMLMAFSTASSAATLPVTMETVKRDAGVSDRTASFTLPLGATVNMDGTALYECVVVIFIGQIYGVLQGFEIGFATQFTVVLLALLTSVGVAGIPAASLVAITVILGVVGLPLEAVGLIWVTDRILDMCRTSVNVFSDTCGAVIIGRSEGESGIYAR